jgi:hypothetical protein
MVMRAPSIYIAGLIMVKVNYIKQVFAYESLVYFSYNKVRIYCVEHDLPYNNIRFLNEGYRNLTVRNIFHYSNIMAYDCAKSLHDKYLLY